MTADPKSQPGDPAPPATPRPAVPQPPSWAERLRRSGHFVVVPAPEDGAGDRVVRFEPPVLGSLALIFGVAGLVQKPLAFAPLALVFAAAALVRGQRRLAAIGGVSALAALAGSYAFWTLIGLGWLWAQLF